MNALMDVCTSANWIEVGAYVKARPGLERALTVATRELKAPHLFVGHKPRLLYVVAQSDSADPEATLRQEACVLRHIELPSVVFSLVCKRAFIKGAVIMADGLARMDYAVQSVIERY